jgi:hypothetical protein
MNLMKNLEIVLLSVFLVVGCAPQSEVSPEFPAPRVDLYVIDSSTSAVKDENNSTIKLFERVENRILQDISDSALGSPTMELNGDLLEGKSPVGFYLQQLTNRASENQIVQIKDLQGSQNIWDKVNSESYGLNSTNLNILWSKLQQISGEIKDFQGICQDEVFNSLSGQSVTKEEKKTLSLMLCDETEGSISRLEDFKSKIESFVESTGGSAGSDIFGMLINTNQWIKTLTYKDNQEVKFNLIILSDMVHDADSDKDLNKRIAGLDSSAAIALGKKDALELSISFPDNVDIYVIGIGAFGENYNTKADFTQTLTNYWTGFFESGNTNVFFTPSLDEVNLG